MSDLFQIKPATIALVCNQLTLDRHMGAATSATPRGASRPQPSAHLPLLLLSLACLRAREIFLSPPVLPRLCFPNSTQTSARFQTFLLSAPKLMCIRAERLVCTQLRTWARSVAQVQQNSPLVCLHVRHIKTAGLCPCGCEIPLGYVCER